MTVELNALDAARSAVSALLDGGVRDVVIAPGSRSAPLAYALAESEARGELRLHVRIDERAAAFTALGLSLGSLRPVPVVTTSGTAVGELLPAVMEANHAGVELVVLTPQAIDRLPLNGRNYTDLALLQPGVLAYPHRDGGSVVAHGLAMSVNGQDPRANVYLLDGTLLNGAGSNLDPEKILACMLQREKAGGHSERSIAIGTISGHALKVARANPIHALRYE